MSEVRPWVGSVISLGQFHVKRFLKVIDFSNEPQVQFSISEPSNGAERERQAWSHVANAFSQPVTPTDDVADYAPTQVIAEAIRRQGYAGIKYRSTLGAGLNVALFDPRNAQLMIRKLCDTKSVHFVFTERGNDNALERRLFELAQELQEAEEAEVLRMKSEIDR